MKNLFLAALLILVYGHANAQLTGVRNIPGNYATLQLAIADLNAQGVGAGGVTLNLLPGNPQTAPSGGYVITAQGTATNPIVFEGNGNTITAGLIPSISISDGVVKIIGGDYITIAHFVIRENPGNTETNLNTNTMTEWGIALLAGSTSNGAQFNTIVGNTISLNVNYQDAVGVYSNTRHLFSDPQAASNPNNGTTAPNHNNRVLDNAIANVNFGIVFSGSDIVDYMDLQTEIDGNSITNYGWQWSVNGFNGVTGSPVCGIYLGNQNFHTISDNTLIAAPLTVSHFTLSVCCIMTEYTTPPSGAVTNTITRNTVTFSQTGTSAAFGISTTAPLVAMANLTVNITDNLIANCEITAANNWLVCIANRMAAGVVNITGNTVRGSLVSGTGAHFTGISNEAGMTMINLSNNHIGDASGGAVTHTSAGLNFCTGISNFTYISAPSAVLIINGNDFRGITFQGGIGAVTLITNSAANFSQTINGNTFTALSPGNQGVVRFISNDVALPAGGMMTVHNNGIVGGFTQTTNASVTLFSSANTTLSDPAATKSIQGNNFSNISVAGGAITGWFDGDGTNAGAGPQKLFVNNTFSNWTGGSTVNVLQANLAGTGSVINGNLLSNITASGNVTGILYATQSSGANHAISGNTISGLSSTGAAVLGISAGSPNVTLLTVADNAITGLSAANSDATGIKLTGAAQANLSRNKVADLQSNGTATGIHLNSGTTYRVSNNVIGDLRTATAGTETALSGIMITSVTTAELYYNTIYLNATSTGTDFGSCGIYQTTGSTSLTMRNNLVVNRSVANGTGKTVAFRRVTTSLTDYSTASNNNSFYAGTPAAGNLVYFDGTTGDQTIAAYKTRMSPREAASLNVNPAFASTTAISPVFLHIPAATVTVLESGGGAIAGYTTDYDNDARPGPAGSVNGGGTAPDIGADEFDGIIGCNSLPVAGTAMINTPAVCGSGTFTLSLTGHTVGNGITYQWQSSPVNGGPYVNIPGATTATYTTGVVTGTTYFVAVVTCAEAGLSSVSTAIGAIVKPLPNVTASATETTVCAETSVTLSGSGSAATYSWTGGVTNNTAFVPTATETFTVTATDANGCQDIDMITITVNPLPNVTASASDTTVCEWDPVTLSGSGAVNYVWTGGLDNNVPFFATGSETFIVTGTDENGCQNYYVIAITVNALPHVVAIASETTVCAGASVTLSGYAASTYSWSGGVTNNTAFSAMTTETYTVTGTDANGCQDTNTITITVNDLPNVSAAATQTTVCAGASVTLSGDGAATYDWTGGVTDNTAFTPTATETFTVTGTDANGCENSDAITVTVNALPVVIAAATETTVCAGASVTLSGDGAANYDWTGGVTDNTAFTPTATETFTVTGTDANGCEDTDEITITVNDLPNVTAAATETTICAGTSVMLSGNGAATYDWTGGVTDNTAFTPTATETFTVTGTDANGCENGDTITVTVNALPVVTLSLPFELFCQTDGNSALSGEAPAGGTWSGSGVAGNVFDPATAGLGEHAVVYSYTDANGCAASASDEVTVDDCSGVDDMTAMTGVSLYPNPNNGQFVIELSAEPAAPLKVAIMSGTGQLVQSFTLLTTLEQVDLSSVEDGVYLVRITGGTNERIYRVIKQ